MISIEIGKPYYKKIAPNTEGMILEYEAEVGFTLSVIYPDFSADELASFKRGDYRFGLTNVDDLLFLTISLGDNILISEAPFEFSLYPDYKELLQSFPDLSDEESGLSLNLIAIDSNGGTVKGLRTIGLANDFSKALLDECVKQAENHRFSVQEYYTKLAAIRSRFSIEDIAKMAFIRCIKL